MKIIEPGKIAGKWSIKHRCTAWGNSGSGCGALLELEMDDLRYYPGTGGEVTWGYRDPAVSFKCPCCGKLTDLGLNDYPPAHTKLKRWTREWQDEFVND
jgi:hypothetical protein